MDLKQRTAVFKALGNAARLRMVDALGNGELCVCKLVEVAGLRWATVSRHLAILKEAGVVEDEKRGKQVFYRLRLCCIAEMNRCLDGNTCGVGKKAGKCAGGRKPRG
jgi:DNA-binding transcriptional ArsR family regulator